MAPSPPGALSCGCMSALQRDPNISVGLRLQLDEDFTLCDGAGVLERLFEMPALDLERHLMKFSWRTSSTDAEARQQLNEFVISVEQGAKDPAEEAGPPAPPPSAATAVEEGRASLQEKTSNIQTTTALAVLNHGRRLAACSPQIPTSGDHPISSDCEQASTVDLTGDLRVSAAGGVMRTVDRGGSGGRHFTVGAGETLVVEMLRLSNGAVSTSLSGCSFPLYAACGGGIVHVSGSGATVRLHDAWLSGGVAYFGGAILAIGDGAQVHLNRTSITSNSARVSLLHDMRPPACTHRRLPLWKCTCCACPGTFPCHFMLSYVVVLTLFSSLLSLFYVVLICAACVGVSTTVRWWWNAPERHGQCHLQQVKHLYQQCKEIWWWNVPV